MTDTDLAELARLQGLRGHPDDFSLEALALAERLAKRLHELRSAAKRVLPHIKDEVYSEHLRDAIHASMGALKPTGGEAMSLDREQTLRDALELILPLARGYAAAHPVGSNAAYIEAADQALAAAPSQPVEDWSDAEVAEKFYLLGRFFDSLRARDYDEDVAAMRGFLHAINAVRT